MMAHVVGQMTGISPLITATFRKYVLSWTEVSGSLSIDSGAHAGKGPILPTALEDLIW